MITQSRLKELLQEDTLFWLLLVLKVVICAALWWQFLPLTSWQAHAVLVGLIVFYVKFVVIGNTRLWYNFHWRNK